jgi:hypothetical protein
MTKQLILVEEGAWNSPGREEAVEILEFCGYAVFEWYLVLDHENQAKYVISSKQPSWRGWRNELADITVFHYPRMQQWERWKPARDKYKREQVEDASTDTTL